MKKIFVYLLTLVAVMTFISCDDKDDPVPGPTIAWESNSDFKKMDITEEMDVKIQVDAPAGIKTFKIAVKSEVLNGKGITELDLIEPGDEMKETVDMILGGAGSPIDKTSCSLDLSKLVLMINDLTAEDSDHTFTLTVGDKQNLTATQTAVFHRVAVAGPTITWASNPDFDKKDITEGMDVKIQVDAPAGISTFKVAVESEALNGKGITELDLIEPGDEMKETVDMILGETESPKDKTTYLLNLSQLVLMINDLTYEDSDHSFTLTVGDKYSQTATQTAVFHRVLDKNGMNAALKVNMFTEFNVKSIDDKTVTFYAELDNTVPSDPKTAYFTYAELVDKGLTGSDENATLKDTDGNKYRLPTVGELNLLFPASEKSGIDDNLLNPCWGTRDKLSSEAENGWLETIYLKNGPDNRPNMVTNADETDGDYRISGKSWLKMGDETEMIKYPAFGGANYQYAIVYGLRFQGTSQCAAYRWESCKIDNSKTERYFSIKIKALGKNDIITTINDVAQESFWTDGYIEFKFPASGFYSGSGATNPTKSNITHRGVYGFCQSSSLYAGDNLSCYATFNLREAYTFRYNGYRIPLRLVKVKR